MEKRHSRYWCGNGCLRIAALACCILGLAAAALVMRDYNRFEAFYWDRTGELELRSIFRPNLEMMVMSSGIFPRRPELARQELALIERALHVYPKAELLCRYAGLLYAIGREVEADAVMARREIAYRGSDCVF